MKEYIKKLQSKSENARKRILYTYMAVSMSVVVLIWIYGLGYHLNQNNEKVAETENEIKPFNLFKESIVNTYNNITASVGNISSVSKIMSNNNENTDNNSVSGKQIDMIIVE